MAQDESAQFVDAVGARFLGFIRYFGGLTMLMGKAIWWTFKGLVFRGERFRWHALCEQMVRVGLGSVGIVMLVQTFIGLILALQMAPPLKTFGQEATIANIIGIAGFRMLGPIFTAVLLTGFAGASIAAELGTMVVAEEIEAMEAMALNPTGFLVVPRVIATLFMTILLTVIADIMIAVGGYITSYLILGSHVYDGYWQLMREQLQYRDFFSGLIQAAFYGLIISSIACYEGLKVRGGAEGVGRATTMTVVYSIVSIVAAACVFTIIFYVFDF